MYNIIELLSQPAVIALIAGVFAVLVARIFTAKPEWKKYEGLMVNAVKIAEKMVPDDTPNKAAARADQAMKVFVQNYKQVYTAEPSPSLVTNVMANMPLVHDAIEKFLNVSTLSSELVSTNE